METASQILITIAVYLGVFGIPIAALIFLIVSIVKFKKTPKEDTAERKKRRTPLIVAVVINSVIWLAFIALMIILSMAMMYM